MSSFNGLYGLQHSSVTNVWKSQQWVIGDCMHSWQLQNAIFRDGAFGYGWAMVVWEKIYEMNYSTAGVVPVCVKNYANNLSKLFSKHFFENTNRCTIVAHIYIWVAKTTVLVSVCFLCFVF